MKRAWLGAVFAVAVSVAAPPAFAHDDAYLDTQKAPNGGQLRMAGPLHYELVTSKNAAASIDSPVVVYVTDHAGKPVSTNGATGSATILAGKTRTAASLAPDGDNRMKGVARYVHAPDMKVIVSITLPGAAPEQARFTPGLVARDEHAGDTHRR
ncbi:MAG: hypothetical protein M9885_00385 [Burkholderiaceae bacterium]|nr:hypothetical protein [Burkholderiaceae bacterium]